MSGPVSDDTLRKIPLFRRLTPPDRARIIECARLCEFARGEKEMVATVVSGTNACAY